MRTEVLELARVAPDPNNPRGEFGDLEALAASFELNGERPGEPVNPPAVVRDGAVWRIVDGERRYRAMMAAKKKEATFLVCEDMDEANAMVAMMATDDKLQLTDEERSRGVQQMLLLGVDEGTVERAGRLEKGSARRVRRGMGATGEKAAQMDIGQLAAIGEAEERGDGEAARAIAETSWWRSEAREWERLRAEQAQAALFRETCERLGVEVLGKKPRGGVFEDGLYDFHDPEKATREKMGAWAGKAASKGFQIVLGDPEKGKWGYGPQAYSTPSKLSEGEAARRSSLNKAKADMTRAKKRRARWVAERLGRPEELGHTLAFFAGDAMRSRYDVGRFLERAGVEFDAVPAGSCPYLVAEHWERADGMTQEELRALLENDRGRTSRNAESFAALARDFNAFLGALVDDGYMPDEGELDLSDRCSAVAAKHTKHRKKGGSK